MKDEYRGFDYLLTEKLVLLKLINKREDGILDTKRRSCRGNSLIVSATSYLKGKRSNQTSYV
jgi:hypothetical protein